MKTRSYRHFMGDFETTVYKGQVATEVWASACVELFTDDVKIFHSIDEQFNYLKSLNSNIIIYYHNLKFDGMFWLSYFLVDLGYKHAADIPENVSDGFKWDSFKDMPDKTISYSISETGQWYRIIVKSGKYIIQIRDSLKLLPFSVKRIGESFNTKHKKLDMEYTGFRYAGCEITPEEQEYIKNDVLVIKEALEIMYNEGHEKLTIGSCCLTEYKRLLGNSAYTEYFPNLYDIPLDKDLYGSENAGQYIRRSYHGGWCYLVKGKESKIHTDGFTADVNSLYPSMMSAESGNPYPVGIPTFWKGNYIPEEAKKQNKYFFVRFECAFKIKENKLPFVQNKSSLLYMPTECLETSDIYDKEKDKYYHYVKDLDGVIRKCTIKMTMTMTDFILFLEHYDTEDLVIYDGCYFNSVIGIFDLYISKYKKIKQESKGARRELSKLFLNNLYGKMASSPDSSFKVAYVKDDKTLGFYTVPANDKIPGFIAVGSAITSYARNFTIRAAQKNYYGKDKRGFIYADTDSIHCDIKPEEVKGIRIDQKEFCCWKLESSWDKGYFVRQKTYIEHVTEEDLKPIDSPYYNIKCAGMPDRCKDLFMISMLGTEYNKDDYNEQELEFLSKKRTLEDFNVGLKIPGKLLPKRIRGGVLLVDSVYEMR